MADFRRAGRCFLCVAGDAQVMKPLWGIVAVGVLTPLLSTLLFFFWRPAEQINYGNILPTETVAAESWRYADGQDFSLADWRGQWVLLTAGGGQCDAACRKRLCRVRQLRLLLPGHYLRLERAWLVTDDTPPPNSLMEDIDCGEVQDIVRRKDVRREDVLIGMDILLGSEISLPESTNPTEDLYLIDPAGVWAMRFAPELTPKQIRQDMARLLKLAKGRRVIH